MDFWLEEDNQQATPQLSRNKPLSFAASSSSEQHSSTGLSQESLPGESLSLSQQLRSPVPSSQEALPLSQQFICAQCDGTEYYPDPATGVPVCSSCFTQSQSQTIKSEDADEDDYGDAMAVAAKSKGKIRGSTGGIENTVELDGRVKRRKKFEEYSVASELPDLETCLNAMKFILKACLRIVYCDMFKLEPQEMQEVNDIAKHIFLGYVRSWALAADRYGELFPELRFSLRDLFLERRYRNGVGKVLLDHALKQPHEEEHITNKSIKMEDSLDHDDNDNDDDTEYLENATVGNSQSEWDQKDIKVKKENGSTGEGESESRRLTRMETARQMKERLYGDATTDNKEQLLAVFWGPCGDRAGSEEAALLLHPGMTMIAAIVWLAGARRGLVMAHQVVEWISNGTLPLVNAYGLLTKKAQSNLCLAKSSFVMALMPSPFVLEQVGSLLLVASGLKTKSAFANGLIIPPVKRGKEPPLIRTLSEPSVYIHLAQLVADLGLSQRVLDTALGTLGAPHVSAGIGYPRLQGVGPGKMNSAADIIAILFIAIVTQADWWGYMAVRCKHYTSATPDRTCCKPFRAFSRRSDELGHITSGPEFDAYLKYCQDILEPSEKKVKVMSGSLETPLHSYANPSVRESDGALESPAETVCPCRVVSEVPFQESDASAPVRRTALRERIFRQLTYSNRQNKRKRSNVKENRARVILHQRERLLLEFLADWIWEEPRTVAASLANLLELKLVS
mmetsp:Transcript_13162/g.36392  ORF Transcript_13162/g.36392 Transcript_13162/m.36392 type:complete len:736 (-) Transcript_13162:1166-3373(-)